MTSRKAKPSADAAGSDERRAKAGDGRVPRSAKGRSPYADAPNLLTVAGSLPRLNAFMTAVDAAGLTALLEDDGPLTVFAPTDVAFGKLAEPELSALLGDKNRLAKVLRHHVVGGRVRAPRQDDPRTALPNFGDDLKLTSETGNYFVDGARIVKTNIRASNGVIHAIDTVLFPTQH